MFPHKTPTSLSNIDYLVSRGYIGFTPLDIDSQGNNVYQTRKNGRQFTVKVIHIKAAVAVNEKTQIDLVRELNILQSLRHPNCLQMVESFRTNSKVYIVMPFLAGGTMHSVISSFGPLCEWNVKSWFPAVALAVRYLHHNKVAHRDLKLDNIFLDDHFNPLITGYGRIVELTGGVPVALSKTYSSPQMLRKSIYNPYKQDVWSLGIIFFTMLNKEAPFSEQDTEETLYTKMLAKSYQLIAHVEAKTSGAAKALISIVLEPDEEKRASIEALCDHSWMPAVFGEAKMIIDQLEKVYREEAYKKLVQPATSPPKK